LISNIAKASFRSATCSSVNPAAAFDMVYVTCTFLWKEIPDLDRQCTGDAPHSERVLAPCDAKMTQPMHSPSGTRLPS
jgi:hypothetical protein